ncbi:trehalase-like domain-containing protein [Amycolatopsis sp. NPDC023774]|uniref:glycoside hydrolase family 15 protein n=1 Tax=Amycolatopsis sp. NPDC023774 TaxID=3155015 RepID=UPI0033D5133F
MNATTSPFPRIADYAFLSDCHTGALVAPDGSVDWLCLRAFDAPSAFGNLLDRGAGSFRFGPHGVRLAALFGFLPGTDERMRKTVDAIADELTENGYVLRYKTDETDDGLSGKEGTLLICSLWLVSALAMVGEMDRELSL